MPEVNFVASDFSIEPAEVGSALDAFNKVDLALHPRNRNAENPIDAFIRYGWEVELWDDGFVSSIRRRAGSLGNAKKVFEAVAPFVKRGSFLMFRSEDATFMWIFDGAALRERQVDIGKPDGGIGAALAKP